LLTVHLLCTEKSKASRNVRVKGFLAVFEVPCRRLQHKAG
jgi:hypothetical protein